ncbi:hypothetical protein [Micromonospora sp. NBC_01813]|uniref:hypothetical protein n=1 Tax=Micromonospora sp. NBC_01813 TaxID=2975988 RepID=UPI002DDB2896|nr:hypothetical protein [Micromonospora sp. NBC_01813]WSA06752.1 hypothetical protein OG958_20990 [Micromonospora sp. NBC_01813]
MRTVIAFLTRSLFRSRLGLAILLLVVVVSVVGVGQVVGRVEGADGPLLGNPAPNPALTIDPTEGDDGIQSLPPEPDPVTAAGADAPETVAVAFATAWLDRELDPDQWHAGLRPYVTEELADKLVGVDPVVVPAERLTGEPALIPYATNLVEVVIEVDSGNLRLRLTGPDGRWLVDGVDWERG